MRSWEEIRRLARAFAADWRDARYERGETQSFYDEFFALFGVRRRQVASYERRVENLDATRRGYIDLFWPGVLIVEQKSAGQDLYKADAQALGYFDWLPERDQPRYILTCDFQRWRLQDLDERRTHSFTLAELPAKVELFAFILGRRRTFRTVAAVNIKAAELLGRLHDALEADGYRGHDLERLMVRLLFCLFADRTGIFEPMGLFHDLIEGETRDDGANVGPALIELFDVLDTPDARRQASLSPELRSFPYINGALFAGAIRTPRFTAAMREMLLDCARFDWGKVSPAIFGSLFQSVMDGRERRAKGAHYTSEDNILKVIGPLFLDDLRAEFARIAARRSGRDAGLREFQRKLARLTFLDPACGCGNFLVIAYRELRRLELEVIERLYPKAMTGTGEERRQGFTDLSLLSLVSVEQFHGIELEEFPSEIARVAMWMTDHLANNEVALAFSQPYARIPLRSSARILHGDALAVDWNTVLPAARCSYVLGNPPFVGFVFRGEAQQDQAGDLMAALGASGSRLDYVAAWFLKAGEYVQGNPTVRIGFVATNSITQGEQVAQLWPALFQRWGLEVAFGHRTFRWTSEAKGKAHVHVVIVGLVHRTHEPATKRLFSYPDIKGEPVESDHSALTAYLFGAEQVANRHLVVQRERVSLAGAPPICVGTKPVDDGHYILDDRARAALIEAEPEAAALIRPFLGGFEFINGASRWLIDVRSAEPDLLRRLPQVRERIAAVRAYRESSGGKLAKALAATPLRYHVTVVPDAPFLVIPEVSSERREYVPIDYIEPPVIPSNKLLVLPHAQLWHFATLTSRAHMAWLRHIGGRLKSDYSYSSGLVYNTFPWPDAAPAQRARVEALAQDVLDERAMHPTASLADLYDPDTMPPGLRRAHAALDRAVDRLYRPAPFATDRDRVEHLFGLYERLVNPVGHAAAAKPARRRR